MNICELINECGGPEKVGVQYIDQCADEMNWSAKQNCTRVTFGTDQVLTPEGLPKLGVIVWLDRGQVKTAITKARAAKGKAVP